LMERSDSELVSSILSGQAADYAVLVKRYQKPVFNLMLRMNFSVSDAADLTQEAFIKAYENLERYNPVRPLFPWLYAIGRNLALDHLRREKTASAAKENLRRQIDLVPNPGGGGNPEEAPDLRRLRQCLRELPEDYREAVVLRFHEGMNMKEIGRALGLSVSGAKMRVRRGLVRLRQAFFGGDHGEEP